MTKLERCKNAIIEGLVTASNWDDEGNITEVTIAATNESEYAVMDNVKGRKLYNLIQQHVRAVGSVGKDKTGRRTIVVTQFNVIRRW